MSGRAETLDRLIRSFDLRVIAVLLVLGFALPASVPVRADEWVRGQNTGQRVWIDTSHYETRQRWIDTSHWEQRGQNVWISSGYSYWVDNSHSDTVIAWMVSDPTWGWPAWGNRWWYQYADQRCPLYYGGLECYMNWTWGGHAHGSNVYCPGAGWRSVWFVWHNHGYWGWQDTSHYEWRIVNVWVASGYWQNYEAWIPAGHWAEPLHGTVTVTKSPPFVFTRWHFLTVDGERHAPNDSRAHLDLTVTGVFNKPITGIREYVIVTRAARDGTREQDLIEVPRKPVVFPVPNVKTTARIEYAHAGLGRHYFVFTAKDGSTAVLYCDIPINGYRSINTGSADADAPVSSFSRSIQDKGSLTF